MDKRIECICHHSGLDLGSGIAFADLAAEEIEVEAVFDDRLVAASAECHVTCKHRKLERFAEVSRITAYADAQGRMDADGVCYLMHIV